jgi:hypothetical protein
MLCAWVGAVALGIFACQSSNAGNAGNGSRMGTEPTLPASPPLNPESPGAPTFVYDAGVHSGADDPPAASGGSGMGPG